MNTTTIQLTDAEIAESIKKVFKKEHRDIMSRCITEMMRDDSTMMSIFYKATLGITPEIPYCVGQTVSADVGGLNDYTFNKKAMVEQGMLNEESGRMLVKIVEIRPFNSNRQCVVEYNYMNKSKPSVMEKKQQDVHNTYLKAIPTEVFPGE